jgi:ABC-type antimicrobial peptide transport system permease subunit
VVDQSAADRLWPGENPIGKSVNARDDTVRSVIGVVRTVRMQLAGGGQFAGMAFLPLSGREQRAFVVLGAGGSAVTLQQIGSVAQEIMPGASASLSPPLAIFERELGQPRFLASFVGALGLLTIALAVIGVFGIVSHQVTRRGREVGIRLAFGAAAGRIRWMVIRDAVAPAMAGVLIGIVPTLWWARTLRLVLHNVEPNDPATFAGAACLVLIIVVAASAMPARRATRIDPLVALRSE